jgi:hypothetical protein
LLVAAPYFNISRYTTYLQRPSILTSLEHAVVIHSLLQTIVLPAKEVVRMGTVALVVIVGKEEWVGAVPGPHVAELRSIPECLIGDLWHTDWVRRRTWTSRSKGSLTCVVHVVLVVGRVDVLAIPASKC